MEIIIPLLVIKIVSWVGIYTINFGRWIWRQNNKTGAIGVWGIAMLATVLPLWMYFFR